MKKAYLFLATGFEETEAIAPADILRRGGVDVKTVSITKELTVNSSHNFQIIADILFEDTDFSDANVLILPGGLKGTEMLNNHEALKQLLLKHSQKNGFIAAICAAPSVLGMLGMLKGKRATCYPGMETKLEDAIVSTNATEWDGNIITGRGMGKSIEFGLEVLKALEGDAISLSIAKQIVF